MTDTKILIIDDDSNVTEVLKAYFANEGYDVKIASDGMEGLNYFKIFSPDLVLLDVMLPKKDGWQVLREIREVSSKPVIMVTAKGDVFDKVLVSRKFGVVEDTAGGAVKLTLVKGVSLCGVVGIDLKAV